jgi:hypothetical protein
MSFKSSWRVLAFATVVCLPAVITCGEDDSPSPSNGSQDAGRTGGSGGSLPGGSGGSGGSTGGTGGSPSAGGSGGSPGSGGSGSGGTSASGGAGGTGGVSDGGPPPPTEAGTSVYTVQCSGDSAVCGYPSAYCLGLNLDEGGVGFACSNDCVSVADCSSAPSGTNAEPSCVLFAEKSRCVLICQNGENLFDCPNGMNCYTYPGSQLGYCLWM